MKHYSQMKDSGIEWIGKIPESWESRKLKTVCNIFGRIGYRGYTINDIVEEGQGAITLSPSNIIDDKFDLNKKIYLSWMKYEESPEIQIFDNDILLVKTGSTIGKVCMITNATEKMTINPQLVVLKSLKINSNFLLFFMVSNVFKDQLYASITGGSTPTTSQEEVLRHHILFPSPKEQKQIASYLDKKTKTIDDEITKNQNLIKLLEEKRQSEINHAVTKGLDDTVAMKDSNIPWIGEIPEGWDVKKLKFLVFSHKKITYGIVQPGKFDENGILLIRGRDYISGWNTKGDIFKVSKELHQKFIRAKVISGDILMCIVGATTGEVNQVPIGINNANITQTTARISCDENKILSKFMLHSLKSSLGKIQVDNFKKGAAQPGLNLKMVEDFVVCTPSLTKQKQIVSYLDEKTTKIDSLISKIQLQISKLQEFRESLISSAVTGKIKVAQA